MMDLNVHKDVTNVLENLPLKLFKQVTLRLLELRINPKPHDYKHLKYHPGCFRIDSGDYRICYKINGNVVEVILVGPRNDVYKKLERKPH